MLDFGTNIWIGASGTVKLQKKEAAAPKAEKPAKKPAAAKVSRCHCKGDYNFLIRA